MFIKTKNSIINLSNTTGVVVRRGVTAEESYRVCTTIAAFDDYDSCVGQTIASYPTEVEAQRVVGAIFNEWTLGMKFVLWEDIEETANVSLKKVEANGVYISHDHGYAPDPAPKHTPADEVIEGEVVE